MTGLICSERHASVGVLILTNPPVNALSIPLVAELTEAFSRQLADPEIRAIVLAASGRTFVAGADISEFARAVAGAGPMPEFHPLLNLIEGSPKPVIAAIQGAVLGIGLELAMAAHYRIASPSAQAGQPEVKIGLIPGAGGTQRLPRIAGVRRAAEMCAFGEPVTAQQALAAGIFDRLVENRSKKDRQADTGPGNLLLESAVSFAGQVATAPPPVTSRRPLVLDRETGQPATPRNTAPLMEELRTQVRQKLRNLEAPLAALDAVEAAVTSESFADGCAAEAEIFQRCLYSDQAKALIHAFFGERAVGKVRGITKETAASPIERAAVVGAGTMGGGIAMTFANAGIPVVLTDQNEEALERGVVTIRSNYERSVTSGRLSREMAEQRLSLISPQVGYHGFDAVGIVIEAVPESLHLKRQVFRDLDRAAAKHCLLASNTSTLDVDALAGETARPHQVLGTHFFSPANVMRLLEIVRARATSPEAIATALALAKRLKKVGVVVGNAFGFVGNRLVIPYMDEAQFLVEEGATPEQVDRVLTEFGMAMGPLAVMDLSGLDVFWHIEQASESLRAAHHETVRRPLGLPLLYHQHRYGQKTGAGWYRYEGRKPMPDSEVVASVQEAAAQAGTRQRAISDEEILDRCLYALINEGAKALEEGIAARPVDIDIIYLTGYGFPAYRGGPMFHADLTGLEKVLSRIQQFERELGSRWTPAPLLERLVREAKPFASLNE